jgi:hypothetical protein
MAAESVCEGRLVVLYTNAKDDSGKTSPQFRVYQVHITEAALKDLKYSVRAERDQLADALATQKVDSLPLCPAWACHPEQCGWWSKCQPPGRFENHVYLASKRK